MRFENVLAKVPGEHVSEARRTLPPAESDTVDERTTEYEVPHLGLVRFYFKRLSSRKGKSRHTFWTADRAILVRSDPHQIGAGETRGGDGKPNIDC
jgi:hypothetical protein